jgi:hypothetical protein
MIGYETLDENAGMVIARERVRELEAQHFRTRLLIAEEPDQATPMAVQLGRELVDLERRIKIHTAPPPAVEQDERGDDGPESGTAEGQAVPDPHQPTPPPRDAPPSGATSNGQAPDPSAADEPADRSARG